MALGAGLTAAMATPAHAGWTDHVKYKRQGSVCKNDGTNVTIGAAVYQQELGKNGVRQMRVEFLLYDSDPNSAGIHSAKARMTKSSASFPNDERNHWWNGGGGAKQTWTVGPGEYWMVAKLTWDRAGKRDWNYKLPVARCSFNIDFSAGW
jgi:hypothetical protein